MASSCANLFSRLAAWGQMGLTGAATWADVLCSVDVKGPGARACAG